MKREILEQLIIQNKSMNTIAKELNCSLTTIKYWFDKYDLKSSF